MTATKRVLDSQEGPARKQRGAAVHPRVSLCVCAAAVVGNCQNLEQITHKVYELARAASMYNVREVVVLSLDPPRTAGTSKGEKLSDSMLVATLLQYFVTPPYLVRSVFKKRFHKYFQHAEKLPRLAQLPFMRQDTPREGKSRYREGVSVAMERPAKMSKQKQFQQTKYVNVGASELLELRAQLVPLNVRVTVDVVEHKIVSPAEAYGDHVGAEAAFGYHVRVADTLVDLFLKSPCNYVQTLWCAAEEYWQGQGRHHSSHGSPTAVSAAGIVREGDLLLIVGKWDHLRASLARGQDQLAEGEGEEAETPAVSSPGQLLDGELLLPAAVMRGNMPTADATLAALTRLECMLERE
ncbi:RNA methyltransferase KNAG_0E01240 [Huiozyma naganishii CBS 8797]|uniref:Uncharacterized protein n=1 Tax=Huiozyma naganishii (strain ATCC MYA-139 / BCRC 22969 / CBS 8797 / KCTC 17520 / NBRC 10181 / NCYC 3082 / Yp74L-3) TaxID=1071383 RepID=J7R6A8_HUIN7|nr:hypothetical protein KNAG_0E01240 [Kazachstania naganishii CBS 8797]CCK70390.1 hypothetical protein KNAG_0E01240 [Kazachstania naganishii CBS 8797]